MLRLGLCCLFRNEPIRFRATTAKALLALDGPSRWKKLDELCCHNVATLRQAIETVHGLAIGAFRILSPLLPRATHPIVGYSIEELPSASHILATMADIRSRAAELDLRLSFHPDQFVVLSSPHGQVLEASIRELEHHGKLAELLGVEAINLHGGGSYGDPSAALQRFRRNFERLPEAVRRRLTVENDDRCHGPRGIMALCRDLEIPFVYDVHHHRCLPDDLSIEGATEACVESWNARGGEPWFHLSSPRGGSKQGPTRPHADYVAPADLPRSWLDLRATVDVEAKAKELAVLRLQRWLRRKGRD